MKAISFLLTSNLPSKADTVHRRVLLGLSRRHCTEGKKSSLFVEIIFVQNQTICLFSGLTLTHREQAKVGGGYLDVGTLHCSLLPGQT